MRRGTKQTPPRFFDPFTSLANLLHTPADRFFNVMVAHLNFTWLHSSYWTTLMVSCSLKRRRFRERVALEQLIHLLFFFFERLHQPISACIVVACLTGHVLFIDSPVQGAWAVRRSRCHIDSSIFRFKLTSDSHLGEWNDHATATATHDDDETFAKPQCLVSPSLEDQSMHYSSNRTRTHAF